jgi:glycyl-tRNA synthetase beta chain
VPSDPVSVAVALADKIDMLTGFWAIDEKPTGSKDPFALRRAALGIIRTIMKSNARIKLLYILERWFENAIRMLVNYGQTRPDTLILKERPTYLDRFLALTDSGEDEEGVFFEDQRIDWDVFDATAQDLLSFFADRLKVHLRESGVRHDLITAVFSLSGEDDLVRMMARVDALKTFLASDDGNNLLTAYRRAVNIVRIEEKNDDRSHDGAVEPALLTAAEETILHGALETAMTASTQALEQEDFGRAMTALAGLRQPLDAFFDEVTVNTKDANTRQNRLALLSQIRATLHQVADFGRIEG